MIDWLSVDVLDQRLGAYAPIGLRLRTFFQGRTNADLATAFGVEPVKRDEPGIGPVAVWCGLVNSMPFSIRSQPARSGWGFEITLPVRVNSGRLDVASLLAAISRLPPAIAACERPHVESLPYVGEGFGVVQVGDDTPIYSSQSREDAVEVLAFLNTAHRSQYTVIRVPGSEPGWIVAGPYSGPYISWLEVTSSEPAAKNQAAKWQAATGAPFSVMRQLGPET